MSEKSKKGKTAKKSMFSLSITTYIRIGIALVTFLLIYMNLDTIFGLVRGTKGIQDTTVDSERYERFERDNVSGSNYRNEAEVTREYLDRGEGAYIPRGEVDRNSYDERGREFIDEERAVSREYFEESPVRPSEKPIVERKRNRTSTNYDSGKGGNITVMSWNLNELGKSKNESEKKYIVNLLRQFDVVAIQEVVTSFYGAQAVASIAEDLNRSGARWKYAISEPTTGRGSERYAYLWKDSKLKLVETPMLSKRLEGDVDREPYLAKFASRDASGDFVLVNFHAVPKDKEPAFEIYQLKYIEEAFPSENIIYLGDFNLEPSHEVFGMLYNRDYSPLFNDLKTTLKRKSIDGIYYSNAYDNMFINENEMKIYDAGAIDFVTDFNSLESARMISDHLPIWVDVGIR